MVGPRRRRGRGRGRGHGRGGRGDGQTTGRGDGGEGGSGSGSGAGQMGHLDQQGLRDLLREIVVEVLGGTRADGGASGEAETQR